MNKILKWVLVVIVVLIVIGVIAGKDKDGSISNPKNEAVNVSEQKITLSEKEYKVVEMMINDDVIASLNGDSSTVKTDYISLSAKELQQSYASNEARGDKNYKGKNIIITGIVESIDSRFGDIPVIRLKTGEMFSNVMVNLAKKYRDIAVDVDKNQKVTLACIGDGIIIGSPTLKECMPVSTVVSKITNEQMGLVNKFIKGSHDVPDFTKMIVLATKIMGKTTNDFTQCKEINSQCLNDAAKAINSEKM